VLFLFRSATSEEFFCVLIYLEYASLRNKKTPRVNCARLPFFLLAVPSLHVRSFSPLDEIDGASPGVGNTTPLFSLFQGTGFSFTFSDQSSPHSSDAPPPCQHRKRPFIRAPACPSLSPSSHQPAFFPSPLPRLSVPRVVSAFHSLFLPLHLSGKRVLSLNTSSNLIVTCFLWALSAQNDSFPLVSSSVQSNASSAEVTLRFSCFSPSPCR